MLIPHPRAHPSAALVGLPFASNAALNAGPRLTIWLSGCVSFKFNTFNANRRGDAYQSTSPCSNFALSSCSIKLAAKLSANVRSDFGGNSSVPISTKNVFCIIFKFLLCCALVRT